MNIILASQGGGGMDMILMLGMIFLVFYFFMIRPQTKKAKDQKNFLANLKKGDKVVTMGGVHGRISAIEDTFYLLEVDNNVKIRIEKSVISLEYTKNLLSNQDVKEKK